MLYLITFPIVAPDEANGDEGIKSIVISVDETILLTL